VWLLFIILEYLFLLKSRLQRYILLILYIFSTSKTIFTAFYSVFIVREKFDSVILQEMIYTVFILVVLGFLICEIFDLQKRKE
jgi:hypothetical protein